MRSGTGGAGAVRDAASRQVADAFPTLWETVEGNARSLPDATAVVCGTTRLDYPALAARCETVAGRLAAAGVERGDRVLWLGRNCHRVLELLVAASRIGAVVCVANWRWGSEELQFVTADLEPALVVWDAGTVPEADGAVPELAAGGRWTTVDRFEAGTGEPPDPPPPMDGRPDDPVLLLYTAAFDGRPHGALFSSTAIFVQAFQVALSKGIDHRSRYLSCGPLFHVATVGPMLATFVMGGTNVFVPDADPHAICEAVDAERCTGAFIVEPTISKIVAHNRDGRYDLRSLRVPPGRPEWNAMVTVEQQAGSAYGLTEGGGVVTSWARGGEGSHGRALPSVQVKVVDLSGGEVPAGAVGEIAIRGPGVMSGYYDRPDLDPGPAAEGWLRTGDLARQERDGSLTFVGSSRRLIKSANENVYPAEVEFCLASHPAVAEVAVIGVPDPLWSQRVKAVLVVAPGQEVTAEELIEHCRRRLASYKKPTVVELVEALPRSGGRIDYGEVDRQYGGGGYPGSR